jgi:hypothetical protein
MLLTFTDSKSKTAFAVNPEYVVCVSIGHDDEKNEKAVVHLINGAIFVEESYLDVVGALQGELRK